MRIDSPPVREFWGEIKANPLAQTKNEHLIWLNWLRELVLALSSDNGGGSFVVKLKFKTSA
jgi:hypothetical protein